MQSVYTIYFNNGGEVVPLRYCNGYSHAEELMESVAADFMKVNYTGRPRRICKYEEGSTAETFKAQLYKDTTFPEGIVFVQKKYESTVYEKTFTPGYLGGTTATKYLGRIGVMAQQYEIPPYVKQQIENQQQQITSQSTVITQQDTTIRRQEQDIKRSDYQIARSDVELEQLRNMLNRHMEEKKSTAAEMDILNVRLAKMESELADAASRMEALEAENINLNEQLILSDVEIGVKMIVPKAPDATNAPPNVVPKRPQSELARKNAAIAPVLSELKEAVVSGSWRKSQLKAIKELKDDKDLERMITKIDSLVIGNTSNKIKIE